MSQIKNFARKFIKGTTKILLIVTLFLFLSLGTVIIAVQFHPVQTKLVNKATSYFSEMIHFPIEMEGVDINWFDEISLQGVSIYDPRKGKMVYIKEVVLDYTIISLTKGKIDIDKVTLRNGKVNVIRYAPDGMTNITEFIDAIREATTPKHKSSKPAVFTIAEVELDNMFFSFHDQRKPFLDDMFDHNHFSLDSIYADVRNLRTIADTFQINVLRLSTVEAERKLRVHELATNFTLTKRDMVFDKLHADIGESSVGDYLRFEYQNINDLSDFNTKINVTSHLDKSLVSFKDLSEFAPELRDYHEKVKISGQLKGQVVNFTGRDLDISFGRHSHVQGKVSFNGLPDWFETFIDCSFKNTTIHSEDLQQYIARQPYEVLRKFHIISGNGEFVGFPKDFVTKGSFNTGLGKLTSDIHLDAKKKDARPEYEGHLKTYDFNLGKLVDMQDYIQLLDMDGQVKGAGFSLDKAEMDLKADVSRIGLNGYNYHNIKTNAMLSERTFNGLISVKDTNLVFEANGKIDLTENQEVFDIKAHLERANLKPLHLSEVETLVRTDLDLNFKGTDINEIVGEANFKNTYLLYSNDREINIDSLYINSSKNGSQRSVELKSDLLALKAQGDFNYTHLYKDIQNLYKEYQMNVANDKAQLNAYYANKKNLDHEKYQMEFFVHIINLNSLFEIYAPTLYLSQGFVVEGNFMHGDNSILNLNTHIDTLFYRENELYNTNVQISTSKLADSSNVLAMFFASSGKQKFRSVPQTENLVLEGIWDNGIIEFTSKIQESNGQNKLDLKGTFSFLENQRVLSFTQSNIYLLNKKWMIAEDNKIYFKPDEIGFKNFALGNRDQFIALNGTISQNADKTAELKIGNFDIEALNSLIPGYNFDGVLNGIISVKDLYHDLDLSGDVSIKNFSLDGFKLGNINGISRWDNVRNKLMLEIDLERDEKVTINLKGFVLPKGTKGKEELHLEANLDNADLEILSPLVKGVMSDLSGKVTGKFKVEGDLKNILVQGKADVRQGQFKIDYLGTTYHFEDAIYLEPNRIGFRKLRLRDEFDNTGMVSGGITHDGFKNFIVDLSGKMTRFNMLNTTEKDNNLFYGTAFVTGDMEILGPFSNLTIKANAKSEKGTRIFIPLNSFAGLEQQSFISFQSHKKMVKEELKKEEDVDLSGINLDFNFEITPDAYAEIIFDKRAGDIIRGYGNGNIKMTIDTRGDFNMYGSYRMVKGNYNYTLAGLISKEFTIQPNSSITWTGDPYGGILDVKAYFETKVSIAPLMSGYDSTTVAAERLRTNPTKVLLGLQGDLMSPQIDLDIDITATNQTAAQVEATFESDIKRNEQELNRQVFSLLVLGQFTSPTSFAGSAGPASNVSQLLTNQLSNWLSQVDENLIIDIDLNGLDKEALSTFNLRLSYTLLDGRLRISRDGTFSNYQNTSQTQQLSNIAGEWTVEYLLNKDGKFRLKLYNKNNQNHLLNMNTGGYTSAGFSILHTQSFNSLEDLFGKGRKKKPVEAPASQDNIPVDDGNSPDNKQDPGPGSSIAPLKEEKE